ncbi:MAG: hypothetical protein E6Q85_10590 [Thiothrix sp.]|nr:MAG: hypothetical protein E6Q85_10590 [Thiothrix sp.]
MTTAISSFNNNVQTAKNSTTNSSLSNLNGFNFLSNLNLFNNPNQQMQMMLLIMQVLQQLMQQLKQTENPTTQTPQTVDLSQSEQTLLDSTFGSNSTEKVVVQDSGAKDGKLSVGDMLIVQNEQGQELKRSSLTSDDLYALRFRENMLKNGAAIGEGWEFSEQLISLKNAALAQPESRSFTGANGSSGTELVVERNQFWEVVERDNNRYLLMRTADAQNQPILASDALNDIFNQRDQYAFDCASPMSLLNLKSSLDTIGADDFNKNAGQLMLSSWFDQYDASQFDGGYISKVRTANAGEISINGIRNLAGETALFDPSKGDKLIAGNAYYFDLPGDTSSAQQGWNALYLGQNAAGGHDFWSNSIGQITVNFESGNYLTAGLLTGYYLGAVVSDPNTERLKAWDTDQSGIS